MLMAGFCLLQAPNPAPRLAVVDRSILVIEVEQGGIARGGQVRYAPEPQDKQVKWGEYQRWIERDGKIIGGLVGAEGKILAPFDQFIAPETSEAALADSGQYQVRVNGRPAAIARLGIKTRPQGLAKVGGFEFKAPLKSQIYLDLAEPLPEGAAVEARGPGIGPLRLSFSSRSSASPSVQVNQFGFRADDPVKVGFLSAWLGSLGSHSFGGPRAFWLVDQKGAAAFEGKTRLRRAASSTDEDNYNRSYSKTDVSEADFSAFAKPGEYRLCVDGAGCSAPFRIGADPYAPAFRAIAKGFLIQRSGIAVGPPLTPFRRPRPMHPADGVKIFASATSLMQSGNGLNTSGDKDNFGSLVRGGTRQVVANAWGGYMDAGDWDRRIQHLDATRQQLDLLELFPKSGLWDKLGIPESGGRLPDLVDEALWGLGVYRRLQLPDGAIRGGIESAEHPLHGEASWQESLTLYAYAPDPWSSFQYAATAAKLSRVLQRLDRAAAGEWLKSARRAMEWAEADLRRRQDEKLPHQVNDMRNLAAVELYRTTGEARWHELFKLTSAFAQPGMELAVWQQYSQPESAWSYLLLPEEQCDKALRSRIEEAMRKTADLTALASETSGFGWGKETGFHPLGFGRLTTPPLVLSRAHWLLKDERYLKALVRTAQYGLGANPNHLCFITGLGRSPQHPLHVDSLASGQAPPAGLVLYGPCDPTYVKDGWEEKLLNPFLTPDYQDWPAVEAYFDVFWMPVTNEYTIMESMGPAQFAYGYLSARK